MNGSDPDTVLIRHSRWKLLFALVLLVILLSFFIVVGPPAEFRGGFGTRTSVVQKLLQGLGAGEFFTLVVYMLIVSTLGAGVAILSVRLFRNEPLVAATYDGVEAKGVLEGRRVPWNMILGFRTVRAKNHDSIEMLIDPEFAPLQKKQWWRHALGLGKDRYMIQNSLTSHSNASVMARLERMRERSGQTEGVENDVDPSVRSELSKLASYRIVPLALLWLLFYYYLSVALFVLIGRNVDEKRKVLDLAESPVVSGVYIVTATLCVIAWLFLVHRANSYALRISRGNHNDLPWRSVGYYFLPIFNLIKPYRNMLQVWSSSGGLGKPKFFLAWWITFWLFYVGEEIAIPLLFSSYDSYESEWIALNMYAVFSGLVSISIFLAIKVVTRVSDVQRFGAVDYE